MQMLLKTPACSLHGNAITKAAVALKMNDHVLLWISDFLAHSQSPSFWVRLCSVGAYEGVYYLSSAFRGCHLL